MSASRKIGRGRSDTGELPVHEGYEFRSVDDEVVKAEVVVTEGRRPKGVLEILDEPVVSEFDADARRAFMAGQSPIGPSNRSHQDPA